MLDTSARLLALLTVLRRRAAWSGPDLAAELGVSPRTIRRDVDKLRTLGYPVQASSGGGGGYRLGAGAAMPPVMLDDVEAVAVAVGLRSAASASVGGVSETALGALTKLEQMLPERLRRSVQALGESTFSFAVDGPIVDPALLSSLALACRERVGATFSYASAAGEVSRRSTEPHAIVHSGFRWYLLAYDVAREDWRTFRVDRVRAPVTLTGRVAVREPPDGDPAGFVQRRLAARRASADTT